jgi:hypothetical protein
MKKLFGWLLAFLGLGLIAGIGYAVYHVVQNEAQYRDELTMPGTEGQGYQVGGLGGWNGAAHLECSGNESATITGVSSSLTEGPIVRAGGNCQLTLVDCNLAGPVVIDASGNAAVTLRGGSVIGAESSIVASGNALVTVEGTAITGPVSRSANATVTGVP